MACLSGKGHGKKLEVMKKLEALPDLCQKQMLWTQMRGSILPANLLEKASTSSSLNSSYNGSTSDRHQSQRHPTQRFMTQQHSDTTPFQHNTIPTQHQSNTTPFRHNTIMTQHQSNTTPFRHNTIPHKATTSLRQHVITPPCHYATTLLSHSEP